MFNFTFPTINGWDGSLAVNDHWQQPRHGPGRLSSFPSLTFPPLLPKQGPVPRLSLMAASLWIKVSLFQTQGLIPSSSGSQEASSFPFPWLSVNINIDGIIYFDINIVIWTRIIKDKDKLLECHASFCLFICLWSDVFHAWVQTVLCLDIIAVGSLRPKS